MKAFVIGGFASIVGGAVYMQTPGGAPNVYAMPLAQAYERLSTVVIEPSNTGPFGRLETTVMGASATSVIWTASGSHARHQCVMSLTEIEPQRTRVDVSCDGGGPSDGAAAGMIGKMVREAAIEMVDATLDGRAYSPRLARGSTATGWPAEAALSQETENARRGAHQMSSEAAQRAAEWNRRDSGWGQQ